MNPARPGRASGDFFRDRLDAIIDMRHPLVRLAGLMPWSDFEEAAREACRQIATGFLVSVA